MKKKGIVKFRCEQDVIDWVKKQASQQGMSEGEFWRFVMKHEKYQKG